MNVLDMVLAQMREELGSQLRFQLDENSQSGVFLLPFKDSLGDNLVVRVRERNGQLVLDDAGMAANTLFLMSETVGGAKGERLVSALSRSFRARLNEAEGVIEMDSTLDEVAGKMLHLTKMLVTLDTMLVEIARQEGEVERPERQSLGPRARHKLHKPLRPLIQAGRVKPRYIVAGKAVPDWMVDLAYEPSPGYLGGRLEMVIFITVDLAVQDPVVKASHAFSRAVDIKAAHGRYDIRVAYDRHGRNSASENAASLLVKHQSDTKAYTATDLADRDKFLDLVGRVMQETGMELHS